MNPAPLTLRAQIWRPCQDRRATIERTAKDEADALRLWESWAKLVPPGGGLLEVTIRREPQ